MHEPSRTVDADGLILLVLRDMTDDEARERLVGELADLIGAMRERLAILADRLDDAVVVEAEAEHAEAAIARHLIAVGGSARHPHRRMRLLNRLRHHAARRHLDEL